MFFVNMFSFHKIEFCVYLTVVILSCSVQSKVFSLCELANEFYYNQSIPMDNLAMWLCIAYFESKYNTSATGPYGGKPEDYGILQISSLYWCDPYNGVKRTIPKNVTHPLLLIQPPNVCNIFCSSLLDDDIKDDVVCAQTIYKQHEKLDGDGYKAWTVYPKCQEKFPLVPEWCFPEGLIPHNLSSKAFDD